MGIVGMTFNEAKKCKHSTVIHKISATSIISLGVCLNSKLGAGRYLMFWDNTNILSPNGLDCSTYVCLHAAYVL